VTATAEKFVPTVRRRQLGTQLRNLRTERGWTVEQVAQELLCSPSKVSRLETGHRGASARDIRDLSNLYEVSDEQRQQMMTLASEGKQRAWWQPLGLSYSAYIDLETEAASISDYGLGNVPGLLQTADYARALIEAVAPDFVAEDVDKLVSARVARQQLLTSDEPPRFRTVLDESVLHRVVGGPAVMLAQFEHLLEASELPAVSLQVLPYEAGALPAGLSKFILLEFAQPGLPDVVFIEGLSGNLYLDDPKEVGTYTAAFSTLTEVALSEDQTRDMIASIVRAHRPPGR
jgi:transcriptional regulator with XRE-family HTH domain